MNNLMIANSFLVVQDLLIWDDQDVKIIACLIFSVKTEKENNKLSLGHLPLCDKI